MFSGIIAPRLQDALTGERCNHNINAGARRLQLNPSYTFHPRRVRRSGCACHWL